MRAIVVLLLLLSTTPAWAQAYEQDYLGARDMASATLKQMAQMPEYNPSQGLGKPELFTPAFHAEYNQRTRDLERVMREVVGPLPTIPGFARTGTLNASLCCYGRFGALDGLAFMGQGGDRLIVTTEPLLKRWLADSTDFWGADAKPSSELSILFKTPSFYRWSGAQDWPVVKRADLPIGLTTNASAIGAFLASAQPGADWMALSVAKAGRIFVAFFRTKTRIDPIAVCDGVPAGQYNDCWTKQAPSQPWFTDLRLEAVAFAEALPG